MTSGCCSLLFPLAHRQEAACNEWCWAVDGSSSLNMCCRHHFQRQKHQMPELLLEKGELGQGDWERQRQFISLNYCATSTAGVISEGGLADVWGIPWQWRIVWLQH